MLMNCTTTISILSYIPFTFYYIAINIAYREVRYTNIILLYGSKFSTNGIERVYGWAVRRNLYDRYDYKMLTIVAWHLRLSSPKINATFLLISMWETNINKFCKLFRYSSEAIGRTSYKILFLAIKLRYLNARQKTIRINKSICRTVSYMTALCSDGHDIFRTFFCAQ